MSSVRHTAGDFLTSTTLPTMTGDWIAGIWLKANAGEYGGAGEHVPFFIGNNQGASAEALSVDIGITNNTTLSVICFRNGGSNIQTQDVLTGSDTGWVFISFQHASGSANYTLRWRRVNQTTFTSVTLTCGAQITAPTTPSIVIGSDPFGGEDAVDSDSRHCFIQQTTMTDAQLLTASRNIDQAPAGTNLHWLRLGSVATAATNGGTAANWTITGTLLDDTTQPNEPGGSLPTQQRVKGFPPRAPLPGIALLGVGILATAAASAPPAITSSGSAAASPFAVTATGAVEFTGTGSAAMSPFAEASSGTFAIPAPAAQAGPRLRGFPSALVAPPGPVLGSGILATAPANNNVTGTGSAACSSFAVSASGLVTFTGTGSAATSSFAAAASGLETFAGTGSAAVPSFAASVAGAESFDSTASSALSNFASLGIGVFAIPAPMALASPRSRATGFPSLRSGPPSTLLGQGFLQPAFPGDTSFGLVALSPFAVSASGLVTFAGNGSAAASSFAASGAGSESFDSTASAAFSPFAATASGLETFTGSGTVTLSSFAFVGLGVFALPAPMALPQPRAIGFPSRLAFPPQKLGSGLLQSGGLNAATISVSAFQVSASGLVTFTGTASAAVSSFAADASALETFTVTGSAAASSFAVTGSGLETFALAGSAALSPFALSGSGLEEFSSSGAAAFSAFAITATGSIAALLTPSFTAQPQPRLYGFPGRIARPAQLLGSGILATPDPPPPNTATVAISPFAVAASGLVTFTATGSAALQPFAVAVSSSEVFAASAAAALSPFAATSSGAETFIGTAGAACSAFGASGAGLESFSCSASAALAPFAASASSAQGLPVTGSGTAAVASFACSAFSSSNVGGPPPTGAFVAAAQPAIPFGRFTS